MSSLKIMSGLGVLAVLFGILSSFFTVDQTQQALVLQFGEPKRLVNKPGLNFKIPFIQEVTYFEKRVLSLVSQDSEEVILADQKRLEVDTYSRFRITDPLLFYQTVRNEFGARQRLESIIDSSVREFLVNLNLQLYYLMPEQKLDLLLLTLILLMIQRVKHMSVHYEMVVEIHHLYSLKFLKEVV